MNNSAILFNILRFIMLLALQVTIFNNINFLGYINPFPYILFIILFPVNGNKVALLLSSFLLGLIMDLFLNSGGVHTTACLILAYYRPYIFKFAFGLSYEYQTVKINESLSPERFSFILISVILHHVILFVLEIFTLDFFWRIITRTLLSTLFTTIICILIIYLIKPSKR
jgi:rod shape-determining protein MreD